ncbi:MAG: hypothetical protein HKN87_13085 [Saprospiraceae bacterium]|nr:hypothetical protein [Saprospiraceae bacterium]
MIDLKLKIGRLERPIILFIIIIACQLSVAAQDSGLRVDKNSVLGGINGAHILLFENENDFARLRLTNSLFSADTNNRFWDIAGRIGPNSSGSDDRLNFYLNGYGNVLSLMGDGQVRITDLGGDGLRNLTVGPEGNLIAENRGPRYLSPWSGEPVNAASPLSLDINPTSWGSRRITTSLNVDELNLERVLFPLSLQEGILDSIVLCYSVSNNNSDGQDAFIHTIGILEMPMTSSTAVVVEESAVHDLSNHCYTFVILDLNIRGPMYLSLQVVLGTNDTIDIGNITVFVSE